MRRRRHANSADIIWHSNVPRAPLVWGINGGEGEGYIFTVGRRNEEEKKKWVVEQQKAPRTTSLTQFHGLFEQIFSGLLLYSSFEAS